MSVQQGQAFEDLRHTVNECTHIVRRRWRLALVGICMVGSVAFWYSQYLPRTYRAVGIFERRDDVVLQDIVQGNTPYGFAHIKATMVLDMTGSRALARAAADLGLMSGAKFVTEGPLTERERATVDALLARYQLKPVVKLLQNSPALDMIRLSCEANDSKIARQFVTTLRDNYITETRERISEILRSTKNFFEAEVDRLQDRLAEIDRRLREDCNQFPGVDPTDLISVGSKLEAVRTQYNLAHQRKAEIEAQIAAREDFLDNARTVFADASGWEGPGPVAPQPVARIDPAVDDAIEKARKEIFDLRTVKRMTEEHPQVKRLRGQIEALESLRATLLEEASEMEPAPLAAKPKADKPDGAYLQWRVQQVRVELELDALRRQHDVIAKQHDESQERFGDMEMLYARLVTRGDELRELREQQNEASRELAVWHHHSTGLDRLLTADSGQRGTQFTLIEEPKDVVVPSRPRMSSIFVVCSGLALAAGALLVALAELFDRSFRSAGQVTRMLGVPVLESVGVIPTPRERRRALLSRLVWTPVLLVLLLSLATAAGAAYVSLRMPSLHERASHRVGELFGTVSSPPQEGTGTSQNSAYASVSQARLGASPLLRRTVSLTWPSPMDDQSL